MSFAGLRDLVSDSLAIDMGSANTIIAVRGRGIVVDEPSIVAISKMNGEVVAIGRAAHEMQGREARDVQLVAPMVDGVVADFERTQKMLAHFVRQARSGIGSWIDYYNRKRPHSSFGGRTPDEVYAMAEMTELLAG